MIIEDTWRNASIEAGTDLLDAGDIFFRTAGLTEVATVGFAATAFGAAAAGVVTAAAMTADSSAAGGTINDALFRDSVAGTQATLTVGLTGSGADIELSSTVIGAGDTLTISSGTVTQPAS